MPIIQPTPIDQLPQPPNPADRSNFNSLAYPFTAAMLPMTEQINKAISDTYNNALEAEAKASEASVSAGEAHNSELAAQEAETLAKNHKNAAAISAGQAGDSETVATNAAGQATLARDKAQKWATETGVVEGGLKGARGYAQDAAQSAADAAGAVQGNFGPAIHAATAKGTPADDDELAVADSQASWSLKKLTWGNLKTSVWAAFKTIATGGSAKDTLGLGTVATRDVATKAQALAGTAGVLPDAAGVQASFGQYGVGSKGTSLGANFDFNSQEAFIDGSWRVEGSPVNGPSWPASYCQFRVTRASGDTVNQTIYGYINNRISFRAGVTNEGHAQDIRNKPWLELIHTGNILTTTGQSTEYPMTQKAVTDALDNIDVSGPRPVKDHGAVATAGSQTVVCNVQESDFHIMSMETADATGTLTIDFANMPDTAGKHFSWHVRLRRGGRKTVEFVQPVAWAGGIKPMLSTEAGGYDLLMFYKVNDETIRAMLIDAWR